MSRILELPIDYCAKADKESPDDSSLQANVIRLNDKRNGKFEAEDIITAKLMSVLGLTHNQASDILHEIIQNRSGDLDLDNPPFGSQCSIIFPFAGNPLCVSFRKKDIPKLLPPLLPNELANLMKIKIKRACVKMRIPSREQ